MTSEGDRNNDPRAPGTSREQPQSVGGDPVTPEELRVAIDRAFDYRGDVTLRLRTGEMVEGYVFDRRREGPTPDQCWVRMFPKDSHEKVSIRYSDIARLEFTGRDTAAGKSFELWVKKYRERKARGEENLSLAPDPLE